jgi:hypothetical protein
MSPTVFRHGSYRAFFFSREETRPHVHLSCPDGEAKFWIEPDVALAGHSPGLSGAQLNEMQQLVEERRNDVIAAWKRHFGGC